MALLRQSQVLVPGEVPPLPPAPRVLTARGLSTFSRHKPRLAYDELVTATESLARLSELRAVCLRSEDEPTFIHSTNSYRVPTVCQGSFWARVTSVGKK